MGEWETDRNFMDFSGQSGINAQKGRAEDFSEDVTGSVSQKNQKCFVFQIQISHNLLYSLKHKIIINIFLRHCTVTE